MSQNPVDFTNWNFLVIDDDTGILRLISDYLKLKNVKEISTFSDGSLAWEAASEKKVDCVILDWKMPDVNGATLINRFRHDSTYKNVPILVASGYLGQEDLSLLEEFPLVAKLEKPFTEKSFSDQIFKLAKEVEWNSKLNQKLDDIFNQSSADIQNIILSLGKLISTSPKPTQSAIESARRLRKMRQMDASCQVLEFTVRKLPNSVRLLSELGKTYLVAGRIPEAKKFLLKAQMNSPENIERLCDLGDIHLQEQKYDQAKRYFDDANRLDPENEKAESGVKLTNNISQFVKKQQQVPKTYASLLNAIGISMAKSEQFESALNHYGFAMKYVHDPKTQAKLAFNSGLCYRRWSKPDEAQEWFEKAVELDWRVRWHEITV